MKCANTGHMCPGVVCLQAFVYGRHFGRRTTQRANQKCPQGEDELKYFVFVHKDACVAWAGPVSEPSLRSSTRV